MIAAVCTGWMVHLPLWALMLMLTPLVADGVIQLKTRYESTNLRRLVTGLLFGYALAILFGWSVSAVWQCGYDLGLRL